MSSCFVVKCAMTYDDHMWVIHVFKTRESAEEFVRLAKEEEAGWDEYDRNSYMIQEKPYSDN